MHTPRTADLPESLRVAACEIAAQLRAHGDRGWIVGGAVRDLALGRTPRDLDMACAATPEATLGWFEVAHAVGRAFGTVVVVASGVGIQLTTFRKDGDYRDGRRPDAVSFGTSVQEDAQRRDFTANALYLDPLDDTFVDPTGGLADLERGLLRCVGDPRERFAEDGLRLLRMARFASAYGLEVEPATRAAARAAEGTLSGVSPERVLAELDAMCSRTGTAGGVALLIELGLVEAALPGWTRTVGHAERRADLFRRLPDPPGVALGLAALVAGGPGNERPGLLERLRPSRDLAERVAEVVTSVRAILDGELPERRGPGGRAARARLVRSGSWGEVELLARAWADVLGRDAAAIDDLADFARAAPPASLFPEPLLRSDDLAEARVERGPRWGQLLARAEELQLDGRLASRADALEWLREAARESE